MSKKTSIIVHNSESCYIKFNKDLTVICRNDHCASMLLSYYEYRINSKREALKEKMQQNPKYKMQEDDYLIEASPKYLSNALFGIYSRSKIIETNKKLFEWGFITIFLEGTQTSKVALNHEVVNQTIAEINEIDLDRLSCKAYVELHNPLCRIKQPLIQNYTTPYVELNTISNYEETNSNKLINNTNVDFQKNESQPRGNSNKNNYVVEEQELVDFLSQLKNKKFRTGVSKVKSNLAARLKQGYTIEEIKSAALNCSKTTYHIENPHHLTPEFITRQDKLEKYLFKSESKIMSDADLKILHDTDYQAYQRQVAINSNLRNK